MVAKASSHEDGILGAHYDELPVFHVVFQDEFFAHVVDQIAIHLLWDFAIAIQEEFRALELRSK
jgi:hypothetical protein